MEKGAYTTQAVIDLWRQGFSIKGIVRRVAKQMDVPQRDIKENVEKDLYEYVMQKEMPKVVW